MRTPRSLDGPWARLGVGLLAALGSAVVLRTALLALVERRPRALERTARARASKARHLVSDAPGHWNEDRRRAR